MSGSLLVLLARSFVYSRNHKIEEASQEILGDFFLVGLASMWRNPIWCQNQLKIVVRENICSTQSNSATVLYLKTSRWSPPQWRCHWASLEHRPAQPQAMQQLLALMNQSQLEVLQCLPHPLKSLSKSVFSSSGIDDARSWTFTSGT